MKLINLTYVAASVLVPFAANATDLPSKKTAHALSTIATKDSWTGAYAGVNAGYSFGSSTLTNLGNRSDPTDDVSDTIDNVHGVIGGVQLGYDYQIGLMVIGVAADFDLASVSGSKTVLFDYGPKGLLETTGKTESNSIGTLRARLGYLLTKNLLGYVTGGVAFSNYTASVSVPGYTPDPIFNSQTVRATGFVVGAGAEYRITDNLTTFAEYRYDNFNSIKFDEINAKADFANNEFRFGLNYRF